MAVATSTVMTTAAVTAAVAAVASAGVSIYSASEQSRSQAAMAEYNRMAQEQNASWQRLAGERAAQADQFNAQIAGFNADSQGQQAKLTAQLASSQNDQLRQQAEFSDMQAGLQRTSAEMMRQQADGQDRQAKEQAGRIRAEKDRILGLQRSQFAAGGVTPEGSPLAVLADTANIYEMQVNDTKLLANLESNKKRYEAGVTDTNAGITALEAAMMRTQADTNSNAIGFNLYQDMYASERNKNSSNLAMSDAKFAEEAAGAGYRINLRQADIEQRAGISQSKGTMMAGYGSALSNISQAGYYGSQAASGWGAGGGNGKAKTPTTTAMKAS